MNINSILTSFWSNVKTYLGNNYLGKTAKATSATTADSATKASQNASGNTLSNTIIKGLSISGKTITYTKLDDSTGTLTTQDTTYSLPTASSTLGGVKTTSTVTSTSGLTACPIISGVPYYKDTNTWTKMTAASASTDGAAGYVPAPTAGKQAYLLRGNGTWTEPGACIINNLSANKSSGSLNSTHEIGTLCFCFCTKGLSAGNGRTVSGAYLFPIGFYIKGYNGHTVPASQQISFSTRWDDPTTASNSLGSGTWKYMGNASGTSDAPIGLFVRVS